MHTLLTDWSMVEHRNGNGLDIRRSKLRPATKWHNGGNRMIEANNKSGIKDVEQSKGRWRAQIKVVGSKIHLGYFDLAEEAARAYDMAAIEAFGEFATLNFPSPGQRSANGGAS